MAPKRRESGFAVVELLIVAAILAFAMAAIWTIYQVTQRSTLFATAGEDAQLTARAVLDRLAADFRLISAGRVTSLGTITTATESRIDFLADADNTLDDRGNFIALGSQANGGDASVTIAPPPPGTSLAMLFPCGAPFTLADGPIMETHALAGTGCVSGNTLALASGETLKTWYPAGSLLRSVESVSYAWDPATGALCRNVGAPCAAPFTLDQTIGGGVTNFQLTYLDAAGAAIPATTLATQAGRDAIRAVRVQLAVTSQSGDQSVTRTMAVAVKPRNVLP